MGLFENLLQMDGQWVLAVNSIHTPVLDRMAWLLSETLVWWPALLVLLYVLIKDKKGEAIVIVVALALMITFADQISSSLIKPLVARPRPTRNMELIPFLEVVNGYRGGRYGFLSSHAANVFAFATFTALLFRHGPYTICIVLWATLVSLSRIYLAVHYPLDVFCGMILGIFSGWLFYWLLCVVVGRGRTAPKSTYAINGLTATRYYRRDVNLLLFSLGIVLATLVVAALKLY